MLSGLLIGVLVAAFVFELINGFHDSANAIATTVYTRALPPRVAILMSAGMNFIGALTHEGVALTIAEGLVSITPELYVILAALVGAIIWDLFTWWKSVPSSSSHALIGSLIGATIVATGGLQDIIWTGVLDKVVIPLITSPLIGLCLGFFPYEACVRALRELGAAPCEPALPPPADLLFHVHGIQSWLE
jgi:inorganic phosphate transporter, PiT family